MSLPADSPFAESLAHISPHPPRSTRELPGFELKRLLSGALIPVVAVALFTLFIPLIFLQDPQVRASRTTLKNARGTVLGQDACCSAPPATSADSTAKPVPTETTKIPTPVGTPVPQNYRGLVLQYRFALPSGETYYGSSYVDESSVFARLKPGAPLPIAYDPADPGFNGIAGDFGKNAVPMAIFAIFPLFGLTFVLSIAFASLKPTWQARRIFQKGELTTGRVLFIAPVRLIAMAQGNGVTTRATVTYTFQNQAGDTIKGSQACDNQWLLNKLDPGSEITVAYLWKKEKQNVFLEPFIG